MCFCCPIIYCYMKKHRNGVQDSVYWDFRILNLACINPENRNPNIFTTRLQVTNNINTPSMLSVWVLLHIALLDRVPTSQVRSDIKRGFTSPFSEIDVLDSSSILLHVAHLLWDLRQVLSNCYFEVENIFLVWKCECGVRVGFVPFWGCFRLLLTP